MQGAQVVFGNVRKFSDCLAEGSDSALMTKPLTGAQTQVRKPRSMAFVIQGVREAGQDDSQRLRSAQRSVLPCRTQQLKHFPNSLSPVCRR